MSDPPGPARSGHVSIYRCNRLDWTDSQVGVRPMQIFSALRVGRRRFTLVAPLLLCRFPPDSTVCCQLQSETAPDLGAMWDRECLQKPSFEAPPRMCD